jgi:hypothetical protein
VRVYFAEDFHYYPVKTQLMKRKTERVGDEIFIEKLIEMDTSEGPVIVPVETVTRMWDQESGNPIISITQIIDMNELTVNKDIPDDRFTIPIHLAKTYENKDDLNEYFSLDTVVDESLKTMPLDYNVSNSNSSDNGHEVTIKKDSSPKQNINALSDRQALASGNSLGRTVVICVFALLVLAMIGIIYCKRRGNHTS